MIEFFEVKFQDSEDDRNLCSLLGKNRLEKMKIIYARMMAVRDKRRAEGR